jgi:hypothetical protein
MWQKIKQWYQTNDQIITWYFIGFFTACFFTDFGRHDFLNATIDLALIIINYIYRTRD